ncbi:MAG: SH3 domain-containing protein [Acidobacteria bacterium]|nr:SH3 domain-containing protein [Acidobacteriota bacterium]
MESRAEAASTMAEAEIALRTRRRTESNNPRVTQAAQFLEMSASEFNNENYGGALYLAVQSKDLVGDSRGRLSGFDTAQRPAEVPFYFSLSLRVTRSSNVREGPGTAFGVAFILEAGAHVTGHAYERQWVRISSEDGRSGWIYSTLVASR